MTLKKTGYQLRRVSLNLRAGDWEFLLEMHGKAAGQIIRDLVIAHVDRSKRIFAERATQLELDLGELIHAGHTNAVSD